MTEATDSRRISICIPTKNEFDKVIQSFAKVIADERISEIVIVDDASENEIFWWKFEDWLEFDAPTEKIKLGRNEESIGTSLNKQRAVIFADNEYILLLHPNHIVETSDIDHIFSEYWDEGIQSHFLFGLFTNRKKFLADFDEEQKALK